MKSIDIFPWNHNFNTGIEEIDQQHKILVKLLNRLASHVAFGANEVELAEIFDELEAYSAYHFSAEEAIWDKWLPESTLEEHHKAVHQEFIHNVQALRQQTDGESKSRLIDEVLAFLARWLATHILESDRHMAMIALAVQSGMTIDQARVDADEKMRGSTRVLIDIILSIYDTLSSNTLHLMRELSEHKRDKNQLNLLTLAVEQSPNAIMITDTDENIQYVNAAFSRISGYTQADVISRNPRLMGSGKTPPATIAAMKHALKSGKHWKGQFHNKRKSGEEYIELTWISPVKAPNGEITNFIAIKEDITAQCQAQQDLDKERQFSGEVIDNLPGVFYMLDRQGDFVRVNPRFLEITGYSKQEMLSMSALQLFEGEDRATIQAAIRQTFEQGDALVEAQMLTKTGTKIPYEFSGHHTCIDGISYLLGLGRDVSVRHLAQEESAYSEARLRTIIESEPECIKVVDADGYLLDMNRAGLIMVEAEHADQVIGRPVLDLIAPEYRQAFDALHQRVIAGRPGRLEYEVIGLSGGRRWLETYAVPMLERDGSTVHLAVTRDISDQRATEEKLRNASNYARSLIEASLDPLVTISASGKIMDVNQATEKVTGHTRQELIGSDFSDYFTESDKAREGYQQVFSEGYVTDYPLAIRHKGGKVTEVLYNASLYRDESGNIQGIFAAARDVTEQRKAQQAITEAKEFAERIAQLRSEFLANMSHEIRTPMNGIIGLAELALNQPNAPVVRDYLEKISTSSQSLLGILNDILDFSKIEAGRMSIEGGPFDLEQVLDNLRNLFGERAAAKQLDFQIRVEEGMPRDLLGDAMRIQQILSNLLGNAIKFTSQGHVLLEVDVKEYKDSKVRLTFSVEDTGIGISRENLHKLFQPFSQVDGSITRRFGGTGLGLAISQKLLELMGGEFEVLSTPGKGTVFRFDLLFGIASEKGFRASRHRISHAAGELEQKLRLSAEALQGARILVAEDNSINQQVVKEFLKLSGMEVDIANHGTEVLDRLRVATYDAILMDVHMPEMGGIEATEHIRQREEFAMLPIIALSAGVTEEERANCLTAGMNDFVAKPINPEILLNALKKWIQRPSTSSSSSGSTTSPDWMQIAQALPDFDFTTIHTMIGGNAGLLASMLRNFLEDFSNFSAQVSAHIERSEFEQAQKQVHKLKGAAANLGAKELHLASEALDAGLKRSIKDDAVLQNWLRVFDAVMTSLARLPAKKMAPESAL